jgi:nicotinate-nucleotide pyrophosphorylase (carboxylating)|tara:strand:- start:16 stop:885 length:870 start_codon:yes stop_codon:yes gene_type:complete
MKELFTQYNTIPDSYIESKILEFLKEDCAHNDLTTQATETQQTQNATAKIVAEEQCVFVGSTIISKIFKETDCAIHILDGQMCNMGDTIATINGNIQLLLSRERVLLNLLQRLCGVASLTNKYVNTLQSQTIKILDTRKTTPGLRLFEKYAVNMGGGYNHRLDLFDGVMFKDNHLAIMNNLERALLILKTNHPDKKIQIEVDTFEQLQNLFLIPKIQIDAILLDNMLPNEVQQCSKLIRGTSPKCFIEVSGGITLNNLLNYQNLDIDGISIGALTHQAVSKNIKIEFIS